MGPLIKLPLCSSGSDHPVDDAPCPCSFSLLTMMIAPVLFPQGLHIVGDHPAL